MRLKDCYNCSRPNELIKNVEEKHTKSAIAKRRETLLQAMETLLKKNVIRQVSGDKAIKIKFNKKGNGHIVDDYLNRINGISKKDLMSLDDGLREAIFDHPSDLYKGRSDNIQYFYYFYDKKKKIYYNVAESVEKHKKWEN